MKDKTDKAVKPVSTKALIRTVRTREKDLARCKKVGIKRLRQLARALNAAARSGKSTLEITALPEWKHFHANQQVMALCEAGLANAAAALK